MANGGYKIVSLENYNFTLGTKHIIAGVYDRIESAYRKPILLSDIVIGSAELPDSFVTFTVSSTDYIGVLYVVPTDATKAEFYTVTITDDDEVTFAKATVTSAT